MATLSINPDDYFVDHIKSIMESMTDDGLQKLYEVVGDERLRRKYANDQPEGAVQGGRTGGDGYPLDVRDHGWIG